MISGAVLLQREVILCAIQYLADAKIDYLQA